ncbi:MAG TPA: thioredoxin family protein [Thermotogota bacterium]|nr:thioredoxin family protein [Thermotogota bacterium]
MSLLKEKDQQAVREKFAKELKNPVKLRFFYSEEDTSEETTITGELLEEIRGLSDGKISVETIKELDGEKAHTYRIDKTPAIVVSSNGDERDNIRFFGLPAGHEFASLLHTLITVSNDYHVELPDTLVEKVRAIDKPVKIQVFVTTSCPHCPPAVVTAHYFAMLNPMITSEMVEANQFEDLSRQYGVQSVPMTIINDGKQTFIGSRNPEEFFKAIEEAI